MVADVEFEAIEYFVTERSGLVFDLRSRTRLVGALSGFLGSNDFESAGDLLKVLREVDFDDPICLALMSLAQDPEAGFFRDPQSFDYVRENALTRLQRHKQSSKVIHAWCGAAATGQEVWSLAITLDTVLDRANDWRFKVLGTDLSAEAIRYAEAGVYTEAEVADGLSDEQIEAYFEKVEGGYRVVDSLRESVDFRQLNLNGSLGALPIFDLVFLRHCLETMREDVRERLGAQLLHHMHPGAYLLTGPGEPNPAGDELLELVTTPHSAAYQINKSVLPAEIFDRNSVEPMAGSGQRGHRLSSGNDPDHIERGCRQLEMGPDDFLALVRLVKKTKMFSSVPDKVIGEIGRRFELWEFDSGVPMITQGQRGEAYFILYDGQAAVWARRGMLKALHEVARLDVGHVFGETSILLDAPANATVKGIGDVKVFVVSRSLVEYVMEKNPTFARELEETVTLRCMDDSVRKTVESSGLPIGELLHSFSRFKEMLKGEDDGAVVPPADSKKTKKPKSPSSAESPEPTDCDEEDLELSEQHAIEATEKDFAELVSMAKILPLFRGFELGDYKPKAGQIMLYKVPANFRILREGKRGDAIFMVYDGGLRVVTGGRFFKKKIELAHLGRGSLVGEMSLILRQPCCANVRTIGESKLFRIDRTLFEEWYYDSLEFQYNVDQIIKERTSGLDKLKP